MKNKFKILVLVFVLLLTSGCGNSKYIQDKDSYI